MIKRAVLCLLCLFFCFHINALAQEEWIINDPSEYTPPNPRDQAVYLMDRMTKEEKIGQLIMAAPEDLTGEKRTESLNCPDSFAAYPYGGIILYGQNIASAEQLQLLTSNILKYSKNCGLYTPFIAVDEEGGTVIRVANKLGLSAAPSAEEIGKTGDENNAYLAGKETGEYLAALGINLNLAPVADVIIIESPEIQSRSYGSDPILVGNMAIEMSDGLNDAGIIACYKHFPGHGTISRNTHNVSTGHSRTLEQMQQAELIPFKMAIDHDADMIMISHLTARELDAAYPASLSPVVIQTILRDQLGFDGVVITDALRMGAVSTEYSVGKAAVLAILAGADMVLAPGDGQAVYRALLAAVEDGTLSMERIELSVERILALKIESGLIQ